MSDQRIYEAIVACGHRPVSLEHVRAVLALYEFRRGLGS